MQIQTMSPSQLRKAGIAALVKPLGPAGMARFIQQYDIGTGDYTKDRNNWLNDMSFDKIMLGINKMRNGDSEEK
ncbi:hypothetical protein Psch_04202 [Pelotomaculum schinkii]|uniref:Uncharacterized protein n=1 Tax=Pelotomaculum schinkii TaxID=78350 RepID=A0A4Y7R5Q3_9FIRM|nr:hypothetical protein [Pelotomaculum schinkii]TEB04073.1 hypothetical protein Psch_04202 [Pelotomaculum schinkii]